MKALPRPCYTQHDPTEYYEHVGCGTPYCSGATVIHCRKCGWYIYECQCGSENGASKISPLQTRKSRLRKRVTKLTDGTNRGTMNRKQLYLATVSITYEFAVAASTEEEAHKIANDSEVLQSVCRNGAEEIESAYIKGQINSVEELPRGWNLEEEPYDGNDNHPTSYYLEDS